VPSRLRRDLDAGRRGRGAHRLGLEHHVVEARRVHLVPDLDEIAVGALHQSVEHLDHVDARAQRRVDGGHLQADDSAADDQHALRDALEQQRARGVDDALVLRHEGQLHRLAAGGDDRLGELDHLLRRSCRPCPRPLRGGAVEEAADAREHFVTLRALAMPARPPVSFLTTPSLNARSFVEVDLGRAVLDAVAAGALDLVHHAGRVQQRLARDAADVQAHAAERVVALDQHRLHAEVGAAEGRRVAAGAGAEHEHLALDIGLAAVRGGAGPSSAAAAGGRGEGAALLPWRERAGAAGAAAGATAAAAAASSVRITEPSLTLSLTLTLMSLTTPACGDGISIDALSDSTITRPVSTAIVSPA
jgi:hypothetical protein